MRNILGIAATEDLCDIDVDFHGLRERDMERVVSTFLSVAETSASTATEAQTDDVAAAAALAATVLEAGMKQTYESPRIERSAKIELSYCEHTTALDPDCRICDTTIQACAEILVRRPELVPGCERKR